MKNILIIYPHWPPSNLAGVHRPRLIAHYLAHFGWNPIILTVHPDFYEEEPDWDMLKTVRPGIEVFHVKARKVGKIRIIGDIGLRAFTSLKKKALEIIGEKNIDFIWIPIPSFYTAILGRILYNKTKIPYGIDYIDPWVRDISNRKNLRSVLSILIARILEPYAIKRASVISGVAEAYFKPAIERNFKDKQPLQVAMPYGFDPFDHEIKLDNITLPWENFPDCIPYLYAGAFLPNSGLFVDLLFKAIKQLKDENKLNTAVKLFFIGTGDYRHKAIAAYARDYSINEHVIEIRERFPYLQVLNFLSAAKGVLLIGSKEKHYTASKTFQAILSHRPVYSILHTESTALSVFEECNANAYLCKYDEQGDMDALFENIKRSFFDYVNENRSYVPDLGKLEKYSSEQSAKALVVAVEKILSNKT